MPFCTLVIIIFIVAIIMEIKTTEKKGSILRSVYFYLASLVTLGIVVGSMIFLGNLGLKTWVFTDADPLSYRLGQPPVLYFDQASTEGVTSKPVIVGTGALTCTDGCTLSESQKDSIAAWKTSYQTWLKSKDNPNAGRLRDLINGFSFFIVALPIFIIHYRIVQRESKRSSPDQRNPIRPAYYYFVSLAALVMVIVAGGILLNLTLKTWVFPSVAETEKNASAIGAALDVYSTSAVQSLVDCGSACRLDAETVTLAKQWAVDYNSWNTFMSQTYNNSERQAASTIPFILFGVPLFWYHWSVARRESKEKREEQSKPVIGESKP
ncbi:MAG: DUF5671 domain-containing protein [Patescibacteria group bacterium]